MQSIQEQQKPLLQQHPTRRESSPEQRYERSLYEQKSSDQLILTLRGVNSQQTTITTYQNGAVAVRVGEPPQVDFLVRVVYFLFVGWWLGYLWALAGYFLCFTMVLLPIGVMMLNRLPMILTLRRT